MKKYVCFFCMLCLTFTSCTNTPSTPVETVEKCFDSLLNKRYVSAKICLENQLEFSDNFMDNIDLQKIEAYTSKILEHTTVGTPCLVSENENYATVIVEITTIDISKCISSQQINFPHNLTLMQLLQLFSFSSITSNPTVHTFTLTLQLEKRDQRWRIIANRALLVQLIGEHLMQQIE